MLVSPAGVYEYEAAHGTVQRHYYKHLEGKETSTNSVATIFAWSGALRKRGELDELPELVAFADRLEAATLATIEAGEMTGDLARITTLPNPTTLSTGEFIQLSPVAWLPKGFPHCPNPKGPTASSQRSGLFRSSQFGKGAFLEYGIWRMCFFGPENWKMCLFDFAKRPI
mgnify:CR=1 FL=1